MQAMYSPLFTEGIGLSDGEVMERMWSILRRFTRMTKEMRPSHRICSHSCPSYFIIHIPTVKSLMLYLLELWYNRAFQWRVIWKGGLIIRILRFSDHYPYHWTLIAYPLKIHSPTLVVSIQILISVRPPRSPFVLWHITSYYHHHHHHHFYYYYYYCYYYYYYCY